MEPVRSGVSVGEAARALGKSKTWVYRALTARILEPVSLNEPIMISVESVQAYVGSNAERVAPAHLTLAHSGRPTRRVASNKRPALKLIIDNTK